MPCIFGASSWAVALGPTVGALLGVCLLSWLLPQRSREEERCLHVPNLSVPLIVPLYIDIAFSWGLLKFIAAYAVMF